MSEIKFQQKYFSVKHNAILHMLFQKLAQLWHICVLFDVGKEAWSDGIYEFIDVRDVANAHILAFAVPSANGRYCLVGANGDSSSLLKILQKLHPSISIPGKYVTISNVSVNLSWYLTSLIRKIFTHNFYIWM